MPIHFFTPRVQRLVQTLDEKQLLKVDSVYKNFYSLTGTIYILCSLLNIVKSICNQLDIREKTMKTKYIKVMAAFIMLLSLLPFNHPAGKINAMYPDFWETSLNAYSIGYGINTGKGRISLSWSAKTGATGYKVLIFNGREYEAIDAGNATSWTSEGKKLWPTSDQIASGEYKIRMDGTGGEFADDPRPVYKNADQTNANQRYYSFKVTAYNEQGEIATTEPAITSIEDQTAPSIPGDLKVKNPLADQFTVAWAPSADSDSTALEYRINVGTSPGKNDAGSGYTTNQSYTFTNLIPRLTYYVQISAKDDTGNYSEFSPPLEIKPRRQLDAVLESYSMQTNLQTNSQTAARITFRNEGVEPWTAKDGYYLVNSQQDFPLSPIKVPLLENEAIEPGASKTFSFTLSAGSSTGTFNSNWSMAKEGPGVFGSNLAKQFTVADTQKPLFDFYKMGDPVFTASKNINLGFFVTDSSHTFFRMKNENSAWSEYQPYNSGMTYNWSLSEGQGQKTVSVMFKDEYGNEAEPVSKTYYLDTTSPVVSIISPANGAYFDGTVSIIGTSSDLNLISYTLSYGQGENPSAWTKIASGGTSISNSIVGIWNTTGLQAGIYTLKLEAIDKANNTAAVHVQVWVKPKEVHRIGGANRFKVEENFNSRILNHSLDTVILASGLNFPDALSGGPLNKALNGTLLLVSDNDTVIKEKVEQAKRLLKPGGKVLILGGTASVSSKVESQFNRLFPVERIGGRNRQEVSVRVADRVNSNPEEIFISWGLSFADSLSVVPHATKTGTPIILQVGKDKLDADVKSYIQNKGIKKATIVSGTGVITPKVEEELRAMGILKVQRIAGKDRFETSLKIAQAFYPDAKKAALSNGTVFADALSGSRFAYINNMPILVIKKDSVPEGVSGFLTTVNTRDFYLYGGEATIAPIVAENLIK
jgi:putative cell wall-binding protein/chitodextrinase